jgi:hypothetical protein
MNFMWHLLIQVGSGIPDIFPTIFILAVNENLCLRKFALQLISFEPIFHLCITGLFPHGSSTFSPMEAGYWQQPTSLGSTITPATAEAATVAGEAR